MSTREPADDLPDDLVVRRSDAVEWVVIAGDALVYDPPTETLHHLNRSAAEVWAACATSGSVAAVVATASGSYRESAVETRVRATVARLLEAGLVVRAGDDSHPS